MAHYSVATTKDRLSSLIDKAMAGEEVVITRHGKPVVEIKLVMGTAPPVPDASEVYDRLHQLRRSQPASDVSFLDLKRMDEEEGAH